MDLLPILRLPVYCHIHWKTQIDPMTTLSVPPRYGLSSTEDIQRIEYLCEILIKISKQLFKKIPPMSLMAHTLISHIFLMDPLDMPPQHIKKWCLFIPVIPKLGAYLYFDWRTVDHRLAMSPNLKCVDRIITPNYLIIYPWFFPSLHI